MFRCVSVFRETAMNHEAMAMVLFNNFLTQLESHCTQEPNFLHRHNLKRIFQQIQVRETCMDHLSCQTHKTVITLQNTGALVQNESGV